MIGEANNMNSLIPEDSQDDALYLERAEEGNQSPLLPHYSLPHNNHAWLPCHHSQEMK
jgi:hypothetical protein